MIKRHVINILILVFAATFVGCVGTIEDKKTKKTKTAEVSNEKVAFTGLVRAEAISHDRVELGFNATSGNNEDITYHIHVNNSAVPIQVKGSTLNLDSSGNLLYTIQNLNINTTYSFRITTLNTKTDTISDISKPLFATTFSNITSDFNGVTKAKALNGEQGKNSIRIEWTPANYTGVSPFFPDVGDTIGYEVAYIKSSEGIKKLNDENYISPSKVLATIPGSFSANPFRSTEQFRIIGGLEPDTEYIFRVRAIQKGIVDFGSSPTYKAERNNRTVKVSTLAATGSYDFDNDSVVVLTPLGIDGLDKLNIRWDSATGEYNSYRVYKVPVLNESVPDQLKSVDIDALNVGADYTLVNADDSYVQLSGLNGYDWYQVKVVVCRNASCLDGFRILSSLHYKRIIPKIAPFGGITSIDHPDDPAKLDKVRLNFEAPVTSFGYLNGFELYCYQDQNDSSPVIMNYNVAVGASGKSNCDGLKRITTSPVTFSAFSSFKKLEIDGITIGSKHCFSLVPVIVGAGYTYRDITNATVKCIIPEIKTPRIEDFPGKVSGCSISQTSIDVSWVLPTGGLYENFEVFWKENDGTSFKFSDAAVAAAGYSSTDGISGTATNYVINNLIPGKSYYTAVLAYLDDGTRYYSEFNTQTSSCAIPLPIAEFKEWVQVFAIGPKVNGLIPKDPTGKDSFLIETLDEDLNGGIPLEVLIDSSDPQGQDIDPTYTLNRSGSAQFNGVYGALNGVDTNDFNQYSNGGIIRFAWKDVTFYSGLSSMKDIITLYEGATPIKKDREFGYRVYRSDNNMISWVELTNNDFGFQTVTNSGPVRAIARSTRVRNNVAGVFEDTILFTDYSVKTTSSTGSSDRARSYHYKVIPIFNNTPLSYSNADSEHIIKITLPPKNMALVHRMMANRTMCLELGKTINKDSGAHYSCLYNGVGSSSLTKPGILGNTVYDIGSDLLVDRFELGCNFTRGDPTYSYAGQLEDFADTTFKGCVSNGSAHDESKVSDPATDYTKVVSGDCFGTDQNSMATATCTDNNIPHENYAFPGARGGVLDCTVPNQNRNDYQYRKFQPQSEYAAVYYNRQLGQSQRAYKGANGGSINSAGWYASGCFINLPSIDTTDGNKITSRWLPSNTLFNDRLTDSGTTAKITLIHDSISSLLSKADLYNATDTSAPNLNYGTIKRFNASTKLGRVFSSNNSKLPPLRNLAQDDLSELCSQYQVEVGYETGSIFYPTSLEKSKRIIHKKEQIAASSWPDQSVFDETKVTNLESGGATSSYLAGVGTDSDGCSSNDRIGLDGVETLAVGNAIPSLFPHQNSSTINDTVITGSSTFDGNGRNQNTQKCVSKYGVQDMVGNVAEYASDQFHCDFTGETLYLGVDGDVLNSIAYSPLMESYRRYNIATLTAWVDSSPNTGSCSTVESGGARLGGYTSGSIFNDIYDSAGNPDPFVISTTKLFDQDSVLSARNGDGAFMDFGQLNLGPPLSLGNTLSLSMTGVSVDNRRAKFFNPVLGMPLECLNNSCDNSTDNLTIVSSPQMANAGLGLNIANYLISDFPTNNSQIYNFGLKDIYQHDSFSSPNAFGGTIDYINAVDPALGFPAVPDSRIEYKTADGVIDTVNTSMVDFRIQRGQPLTMVTGGHSTSQGNGKYNFLIEGTSRDSQAAWRYINASGRCVVRINEND